MTWGVPFLSGVLVGFVVCFFMFCALAAIWKAKANNDEDWQ